MSPGRLALRGLQPQLGRLPVGDQPCPDLTRVNGQGSAGLCCGTWAAAAATVIEGRMSTLTSTPRCRGPVRARPRPGGACCRVQRSAPLSIPIEHRSEIELLWTRNLSGELRTSRRGCCTVPTPPPMSLRRPSKSQQYVGVSLGTCIVGPSGPDFSGYSRIRHSMCRTRRKSDRS